MKKGARIDNIFWILMIIIFLLIGILGFTIVPGCYRESTGRETLLGCGSLVIFSAGSIFVAGVILFYIAYIEDWIREKITNYRIKKAGKKV